jgi:outer membrane protein assembly factor BamB
VNMPWIAVILLTSSALANWPRFRGPDGNSVATADGLPTSWSTSEGIRWKTDLPGSGSSSPIVVSNRVFLSAYSGFAQSEDSPGEKANLKRHMLCYDARNGRKVWEDVIPVERFVQDYKRFLLHHGYASHTPVCDGQTVFAYFANSGAVAYDLAGKRLWQTDLGTHTHGGFGSGGALALWRNLVFINASSESKRVVALDRRSGDLVWEVGNVIQCYNTPTVMPDGEAGHVLLIVFREKLLAVDPLTGQTKWETTSCPTYVCNSPTVIGDTVYMTHGYRGPTVAMKGDGSQIWAKKVTATVSSPAVAGKRLFVARENLLFARDAGTGVALYTERFAPSGTRIYALPLVANDKLYVITRKQGTYVFGLGDTYELIAHNVIAGDASRFNASPAVYANHLYLRSDNALYCIGK